MEQLAGGHEGLRNELAFDEHFDEHIDCLNAAVAHDSASDVAAMGMVESAGEDLDDAKAFLVECRSVPLLRTVSAVDY